MYINSEGEYPRYIGDIQLEHPDWQEGQDLPAGWAEVTPEQRPVTSDTQKVVEVAPVEIDGVWHQSWQLVDLTQDEIDFKNAPNTVREKLIELGLNNGEISYLFRGIR